MRTICVFTGTRAEYGLLRPLLRRIDAAQALHLQLLVSGTHLSPAHGMTIREIEGDGFHIHQRVPMLGEGDEPPDICRAMARGLEGLSGALDRMAPDLVVILGDRYEAFCAATAATMLSIPIAHIHGGEATYGAVDEVLRHAITKMAHLHFTSTEAYRQRVIQLGEHPDRVFRVGALGIETIRALVPATRDAIAKDIGFPLDQPFVLVTLHPETRRRGTAGELANALLQALDEVKGPRVLFTRANADPEGHEINRRLEAYTAQRGERCALHASLGIERYLGAMRYAQAVVGNSSSGLLEAPAMGVPSVDIGGRQAGRVRPRSVVHCTPGSGDIADAIRRAIEPAFRAGIEDQDNPYEADFLPSQAIAEVLWTTPLDGLLAKRFHDLP
ncbi:MAG: UDP-N-acetylglucosamine 2-epimerase [Myxococcota bacterium]|nr:UDP-N-acetylglucosamine 2-epimerase [Myxococcota bacterium]